MLTHYHRRQSTPTKNRRHVSPSHGLLHDNYTSTIAAPMSRTYSGMTLRQEIADIATALFGTIVRNFRNKRAAHALQMLDDHMLKDIGITRSDIDYVVRTGRRLRRE